MAADRPGTTILPIHGKAPRIHDSAFVAPGCRIIGDVAILSTRLRKPLSARLFLVPGKAAGEIARFDDPYLTDSAVLAVR